MMDDTFSQPATQAPDARLDSIPDGAKVPDLTGYTMGDLRAALKPQPDPYYFVKKQDIRAGSYPDKSISLRKADVPWAERPFVIGRVGNTQKPGPGGQWDYVVTGAPVILDNSWMTLNFQCCPRIRGMTRQFRLQHLYYYNVTVAGVTLANYLATLQHTPYTTGPWDPGAPYNVGKALVIFSRLSQHVSVNDDGIGQFNRLGI